MSFGEIADYGADLKRNPLGAIFRGVLPFAVLEKKIGDWIAALK